MIFIIIGEERTTVPFRSQATPKVAYSRRTFQSAGTQLIINSNDVDKIRRSHSVSIWENSAQECFTGGTASMSHD